MKKIMIMLGAAVMAACVQAAALNWTVTTVPGVTEGADLTKYTAVLYFTEGAGTVGSTFTTVNKDDVIASLQAGQLAAGYSLAKNLNAAGAATGATGLSSAFDNGDSLTGFVVLLDGSVDNFNNYIVTADKSAAWTSSTGAKTMVFGSQASAEWTAAAPEPTSGLLLLLGVAGLALRRRRA